MIDIAHAKQEFEKYLDEYDREDEQDVYKRQGIHNQDQGSGMPRCALKVIRCVQQDFQAGR